MNEDGLKKKVDDYRISLIEEMRRLRQKEDKDESKYVRGKVHALTSVANVLGIILKEG